MTNQENKLLKDCIKALDIGVAFNLVATHIRKWAACSVKHGAPGVLRKENSDLSHPWLIWCLSSNLKQKVGKTGESGSCTIGFMKNTLHIVQIFRFIIQQLFCYLVALENKTNDYMYVLIPVHIQIKLCYCKYFFLTFKE